MRLLRVPARLTTPRLILRTWRAEDRPAFSALNADPMVMEHIMGTPMSQAESDQLAERIEEHWQKRGYGLYAVELRSTGELAGFIGLHQHLAVPQEVEIGWRLAQSTWGRGLATEGALAVRDLAYGQLRLRSLIAITVAANVRSVRVMEKLGMTYWRQVRFQEWLLTVYRGIPDAVTDTQSQAREGAR
ncbi:GNAT family N-acetyltransferase [Actinopolymorpha rutila]|uniref:RimJ/RimL family protein N-acetyltransferase n=1 Tax=Actinopolymorpha rutila TaxID=446787 RepID=A0A852ZMB7_9ACTN|nr:RimJ/RimL family protein N-acetyltransferase [Actinopolymorpha rutila]